jgi:integrase
MVRPGTVHEACLAYLERVKTRKGEAQARSAEGYLRRRVFSHPIAKIKLDQLLMHDVQQWLDGLLAFESRSAANRDAKAFFAALGNAFRAGLVASDQPWRAVKLFPGAATARAEFLTVVERRRLLKCARAISPALGNLVEAALHTAARPIELARARVSDLDVQHSTLMLLGYKGKDGKPRPRAVPLTPSARAFFERIGKGKLPNDPLLVDDNGRAWRKHDVLFRAARDAAGFGEQVTLYTIRHSVVASWLADGIDTQTVSKVSGTGIAMLEAHHSKFIKHHAADRLAAVKVF